MTSGASFSINPLLLQYITLSVLGRAMSSLLSAGAHVFWSWVGRGGDTLLSQCWDFSLHWLLTAVASVLWRTGPRVFEVQALLHVDLVTVVPGL